VNTTSEKIDHHRRHLLGAAALTAAAAQLGMLVSASAQSAKPTLIKRGTNVTFAPRLESFGTSTRAGARASWGITWSRHSVVFCARHWTKWAAQVDTASQAPTEAKSTSGEQVNEKAPYLYGLVEFQGQRPARVRCQNESWRQLPSPG
jgi:hypothetical protein